MEREKSCSVDADFQKKWSGRVCGKWNWASLSASGNTGYERAERTGQLSKGAGDYSDHKEASASDGMGWEWTGVYQYTLCCGSPVGEKTDKTLWTDRDQRRSALWLLVSGSRLSAVGQTAWICACGLQYI